jgi:hypothetical protein
MTTRSIVKLAVAYSLAAVFVGLFAAAGAQLRQPEVLSKSGNTEPAKPAPLSDQWAKDRKGFIDACESHGGAAVPRAGIVGSDGLVCVQPARSVAAEARLGCRPTGSPQATQPAAGQDEPPPRAMFSITRGTCDPTR